MLEVTQGLFETDDDDYLELKLVESLCWVTGNFAQYEIKSDNNKNLSFWLSGWNKAVIGWFYK